jgi:hypothetical protein
MSMNPVSRLFLLLSAATALVLTACASTTIRSSWTAPDAARTPLSKVAVFAIGPNRERARIAEAVVAHRIGSIAQPAHLLLKPEEEGDQAKVEARLRQLGYDGAVTMRLLAVEDRRTYVPPTVMATGPGPIMPGYVPGYVPGLGFYNYYGLAYQQVYVTPGYVSQYKEVVVETIAYSLKRNEALWSGVTETVDPDSVADGASEIGDAIVRELTKAGVLPAK